MCPSLTSTRSPVVAGPLTGPAPPAIAGSARLLRGAHGWWFLGGRKVLLLGPGAVDAAGRLDPAAEREVLATGADGPIPVHAYALTVLTTTACNLGCGYCFQNTGQDRRGGSRPPRIDGAAVSRQTAREILDFAAGRMAAAGLPELDLYLFGGEPLLNPAGCRDLLEFAQAVGLRSAHLISNGTLLTPTLARELAALGVGSVQITLDGHRDQHDLIRIRRSGGAGTFDTILARMARAAELTTLDWHVRVNVSHRNRDGMAELVEEIARRVDPDRCTLAFHLVDDTGIGYANALTRDAALAEQFAQWSVRAAELGFRLRQPAAASPCRWCSHAVRSGRLGAVVNADGTLYSCWESAGRNGWEVGTVREGYRPAGEVEDRWVGCGYRSRGRDSAAAVRLFSDTVDARILDHLYRTGRLELSTVGARRPGPPAGA